MAVGVVGDERGGEVDRSGDVGIFPIETRLCAGGALGDEGAKGWDMMVFGENRS